MEPVVVDGWTSLEHARLLLECLALTSGSADIAVDRLGRRLESARFPSAPVLVVSTHPTTLSEQLAQRLRRPIACLLAGELERYDFYEGPPVAILSGKEAG
jgi:hypothetical protein